MSDLIMSEESIRLKTLLESLTLSSEYLVNLKERIHDHFKNGLEKRKVYKLIDTPPYDSYVKNINRYTRTNRTGVYYGIDIGGSTIKIVRTDFNISENNTIEEIIDLNICYVSNEMPMGFRDAFCPAERIFEFIVEKILALEEKYNDSDVAIGLSFSFGFSMISLDQMVVRSMAKGWHTGQKVNDPIIGQDIVDRINNILVRTTSSSVVIGCINDTVATIISGAYLYKNSIANGSIGVINGSGFNIGIYSDQFGEYGFEGEILNTEIGGLTILPDHNIEMKISNNLTLEHKISGLYLNLLLEYGMNYVFGEDIIKPHSIRTEDIADIFENSVKDDRSRDILRKHINNHNLTSYHVTVFTSIAKAIMSRSAKLIGCACSGLSSWGSNADSEIMIAVTGSVIYNNKNYQDMIQKTVQELRQSSQSKWIPISDASTLGAVVLASLESETVVQ